MAIGPSLRGRRLRRLAEALGEPFGLRLALVAGFAGAVAFRIWLTTANVTPWIMVDELIFSEQAKSIAHHGDLGVRDHELGVFSLLYPVLIAPGWLLATGREAYELAKATNGVLVTLGAVPVYLWARRLLPLVEAVLVTVLALSIPPLLLAANVMSDNAFFPAFLLGAFSLGLALERPTYRRQGLALAAIALACAVRLQGFVLLLVLPTAILLYALLEPLPPGRSRLGRLTASVRPFLPSLAVLPLGVLLYAVVVLAVGANWSSVLGGYHVAGGSGYSPVEAARWVVYHFAELDLASGLVTIPATILLLVWAVRGGSGSLPAERAFVAVTVSSLVWFVLQAGVFASRFAGRVEERLMFYVVPLLVLGLVLWLLRRPVQPRLISALAFAVPAALVLALPLGRLLDSSILSDTFGLIPFYALRGTLGAVGVKWILAALAVVAGSLFVLLPRTMAQLVLPLGLGVLLAVSTISAARQMSKQSRLELAASTLGRHTRWVDATVGKDANVGALLTRRIDSRALWQLEFWNESLGPVYNLDRKEPGGLPHVAVSVDRISGRLERRTGGAPPDYLVTPRQSEPAGELVSQQGVWALYRVRPPLRLAADVEGVDPDGWMGRRASDTVYATSRRGSSTIAVTVSRASWGGADRPSPVRIEARSLGDGKLLAERSWVVHSRATKTFHLGTFREPYRVRLFVPRTFSPSDFGLRDQRQLGAQVVFRRTPA